MKVVEEGEVWIMEQSGGARREKESVSSVRILQKFDLSMCLLFPLGSLDGVYCGP
jgi:hypothetical protein